MLKPRPCEYCAKEFTPRDKRQVGRFCSTLCNRKILRRNQLKDYREYLQEETEFEKYTWLQEHFEKFVVKNEIGCWTWNGSKVHGYGNINHRGKTMKAHRMSWLVHYGEIPHGLFVLHKCDTRSCTNPKHLFLGTQTDNMQDMAKKYRTKIKPTLNEEQIREIRKLIEVGVPDTRIGKKYNVSGNAIFNIRHGKTWKNLRNSTH